MKLLQILCAIFFCILAGTNLNAQDKLPIKFGKVNATDFEIKSPLIDSNTNAVIVADVGKSEFVANTTDLSLSIIFSEKKRIKIINKNGFGAATITIPIYVGVNGSEETLDNLKAYTYNIEDGEVKETKLGKSDVFTEKHNKNWKYKKFTFPNLKEGSIVEYSYEIKSDFFFEFRSWEFQDEYPVLWSQYEANIPEFFQYVMITQGYHPYFINKTESSRVDFKFTQHYDLSDDERRNGVPAYQTVSIPGNSDYHTWVMKDVPGLKPEPFTTTVQNAISKIEFQLKQIKYPNSIPTEYMNSWEKVSKELLENDKFGICINRNNNWLNDDVENIVKGAKTQTEKATLIYNYVRDHFVWDGKNDVLITSNLKDVYKQKSGSVADINLLLIAMLRSSNIDADPVILSTRNHGYTHEFYPLIDRYNYVIAQINIDNENIYLDATESNLTFGHLPLRVFNGHARIIKKGNAIPVYFVADSINEKSNTNLFISNMDKGGIEGSFTHDLGFYESLDLRNELNKKSKEEYIKNVKEPFSDNIEISNIEIDSLQLKEMPVAIKYDLKFKEFEDADIVYFNPMLNNALKKNPFASAERYYPVEMPFLKNQVFTLTMDIPNGYKVDELPKSTRVLLNEEDGMFEYLISNDGTGIQMRCTLVLHKAKFTNEDYQTLRDFYAFIVKKESEQIVFKKIK